LPVGSAAFLKVRILLSSMAACQAASLDFKSVPAKKYLQHSGTMGCRSSVSVPYNFNPFCCGFDICDLEPCQRPGPTSNFLPPKQDLSLVQGLQAVETAICLGPDGNQRNTDENGQQKRVTLDQRTPDHQAPALDCSDGQCYTAGRRANANFPNATREPSRQTPHSSNSQ
jgi:hypothetical protein